MQDQDIEQLARWATPYLTFTDADGHPVAGDAIGTIVIFGVDMTKATGATTDIAWRTSSPVPLTPVIADSASYKNATDVSQSQTFTHTFTDAKTFTWTLNEQLKLGVSDKGKVNFLFVQDELTISFEFTLGSTQSWTTTDTDQLAITFPLTVPAHSLVTAKWIIERLSNQKLPFTGTFELGGTVGLSAYTTTGQYTWFGSAGELMAASIRGGATDWEVSGDTAILTFEGTLEADEGVNTYVDVEQSPLAGGAAKHMVFPYPRTKSLPRRRQSTSNPQSSQHVAQQLIASIVSTPKHQSGQKHRSSGNFSTGNAPTDTSQIRWVVVTDDGSSPDGISFDVMQDIHWDTDPTIWSGVRTNQQTNYQSHRSVYIANPSGAESNFTVLVYAITQ